MDRANDGHRALDRALRRERMKVIVGAIGIVLVIVLILGVMQLTRPVPSGHVVGEVAAHDPDARMATVTVDDTSAQVRLAGASVSVAPGDRICLLRLRKWTSGAVSYDRAAPAACDGL